MANDNQIDVLIRASVGELQDAMASAAKAIQGISEAMTGAVSPVNTFSETLKKAGEIAAGVFTGAALVAGVEKLKDELASVTTGATEWAERLENLSGQTGIAVGNLQALQFAATAAGVNFDSLATFSGRLAHALLGAQNSSGQLAHDLKEVGIKPSDLQDTYTGLLKLGDAINEVGKGSVKARQLLTELGGRGALRLEPVIAQLREFSDQARSMGLILDTSVVQQLAEAEKHFNILGAVIDVDKHRIGADLIPVFEAFTKILTQAADRLNVMLQTGNLTAWSVKLADGMFTGAISMLQLLDATNRVTHGLLQSARAFEITADVVTLKFNSAAATGKNGCSITRPISPRVSTPR
jgi:hypothetical protein